MTLIEERKNKVGDNILTQTELMHYGVKGMKWGYRRYQNADGSLTKSGQKRISKKYKK